MSELRFRLVLGRFPVIRVTSTHFVLKLGGTTEMTIEKPNYADIRYGDMLTLYTEALMKPPQG